MLIRGKLQRFKEVRIVRRLRRLHRLEKDKKHSHEKAQKAQDFALMSDRRQRFKEVRIIRRLHSAAEPQPKHRRFDLQLRRSRMFIDNRNQMKVSSFRSEM